jgi:hypothetical protein
MVPLKMTPVDAGPVPTMDAAADAGMSVDAMLGDASVSTAPSCPQAGARLCEDFEGDAWSNLLITNGYLPVIVRDAAAPWQGAAILRTTTTANTYGFVALIASQPPRQVRTRFALRINRTGNNPVYFAILDARQGYRLVLRASGTLAASKIELVGGTIDTQAYLTPDLQQPIAYVPGGRWHTVEWTAQALGTDTAARVSINAQPEVTLSNSDAGMQPRATFNSYIGAGLGTPGNVPGDWEIDFDDWAVWNE